MDEHLNLINTKVYANCGLRLFNYTKEAESIEYEACRFQLNKSSIIYRNAKITPKKTGQFVTCWKRNKEGITAPLSEKDRFDFYIISVSTERRLGQFIFPKSILIDKAIVSTPNKEGKRGFRVYPPWDIPNNKQAEKTQLWQLQYFYEMTTTTDFKKVTELFTVH